MKRESGSVKPKTRKRRTWWWCWTRWKTDWRKSAMSTNKLNCISQNCQLSYSKWWVLQPTFDHLKSSIISPHDLNDSVLSLDVLCTRRTSSDTRRSSPTCSSPSYSSPSSCAASTSRRSSSWPGSLCSTSTTPSRSSSRSSKEEERSPTIKPTEVLQLEQTSRGKL